MVTSDSLEAKMSRILFFNKVLRIVARFGSYYLNIKKVLDISNYARVPSDYTRGKCLVHCISHAMLLTEVLVYVTYVNYVNENQLHVLCLFASCSTSDLKVGTSLLAR